MTICPRCGASLPSHSPRTVSVASAARLRDPFYLTDLRTATAALRLPRRLWRDALADALRDCPGEIVWPDGRPYDPPEIDDVFADGEDQRWISDFARVPEEGRPARLQARVLERARLIDLFFRIRHPEIAARFGRFRPANDNEAGRP